MAIIDSTDIPSGLEQPFFDLFNFASAVTQTQLNIQSRTVSRPRYSKLIDRSLMHLWGPLYNSFTSGRRAEWDAYWLTLPFGSHAGANGWPGSGFSAFIYVNAPLYKNHESILYDPPVVYNYDFFSFFGVQSDELSGSVGTLLHYDNSFIASSSDESVASIGFENLDDFLRVTNVSLKEVGFTLGPELISNGDFSDGITDWTRVEGFALVDSGWCYLSNGNVIVHDAAIVAGNTYQFQYDYQAVNVLP